MRPNVVVVYRGVYLHSNGPFGMTLVASSETVIAVEFAREPNSAD